MDINAQAKLIQSLKIFQLLVMDLALNLAPAPSAGGGEPPAVVGALVDHLVHQAPVADPGAARS